MAASAQLQAQTQPLAQAPPDGSSQSAGVAADSGDAETSVAASM